MNSQLLCWRRDCCVMPWRMFPKRWGILTTSTLLITSDLLRIHRWTLYQMADLRCVARTYSRGEKSEREVMRCSLLHLPPMGIKLSWNTKLLAPKIVCCHLSRFLYCTVLYCTVLYGKSQWSYMLLELAGFFKLHAQFEKTKWFLTTKDTLQQCSHQILDTYSSRLGRGKTW